MDLGPTIVASNDPFRPVTPAGYTETGASGSRWDCDRCGAQVNRTQLHDQFHDQIDKES